MSRFTFVSSHVPTAAVEASARRRGWTPDGATSFWDHGEPDEHEVQSPFPTFAAALADARARIGEDVFGATRVFRLEEEEGDPSSLRRTAMWDVGEDAEVSEDAPDATYDLED